MSYTRGQVASTITENLNDLGVFHEKTADLDESIQDAYDDIALLTGCIIKTASLQWQGQLTYYDFRNLYGLTDYLNTLAIYNVATNQWLFDDLTLRDFDRFRRDWELWIGTPSNWTPSDPEHVAIVPKYGSVATSGAFNPMAFTNAFLIGTNALGNFTLLYQATAPTLVNDTDTFLIADDEIDLIENYVTADMLEQAEELTKAMEYWESYYSGINEYKIRVSNICKSDLLLRV